MTTYSFMDVACTKVGPTGSIDMGYGAQNAKEGISFEPANDKSHMEIGADGAVMHSLHADKSGHITVRLLKTSPVNALLQADYNAQTASAALHGLNVFNVKQIASGDVTIANFCAYKRKPRIVYEENGDMVEWTWDAGTIDTTLGTY